MITSWEILDELHIYSTLLSSWQPKWLKTQDNSVIISAALNAIANQRELLPNEKLLAFKSLNREVSPLKLVPIRQREQLADIAKEGRIGTNSNIYVVYKKSDENRPFITPQQGYYANTISEQMKENWKSLR